MIDSGLVGSTDFYSSHLAERGAARARDVQGIPTQSHMSTSILAYEGKMSFGCTFGPCGVPAVGAIDDPRACERRPVSCCVASVSSRIVPVRSKRVACSRCQHNVSKSKVIQFPCLKPFLRRSEAVTWRAAILFSVHITQFILVFNSYNNAKRFGGGLVFEAHRRLCH